MISPNTIKRTIKWPMRTHFVEASCGEMDCPHYLKGWVTVVPTAGLQADYIRHESDRHFAETKEGQLSRFIFPPGQECFRKPHYKKLDRGPLLFIQGRGVEWDHFTDDWNENSERINRDLGN